MRKHIFKIFLVFVLLISLAGCGKKTSVHIRVDGIGNYTVSKVSRDFVNFSVNQNEIEVTVKKEGTYALFLEGEDGKEYSLELRYADGKVAVTSRDEITIQFETK